MITVNKTIVTQSSEYRDTSVMLAGHLLLVFYCLIFILGFFGNFAVIYVAIQKRKYRNVTNCYVVNLAIADLLFLTLSIPYTTYLGLVDTYPFGDVVCKIYMYLAYVFLMATCDTLAAMSIDRYFYIVLPSSRLHWRTPRTAFIICILVWTISLALIIPYHIISHIGPSNSKLCGGNDQKNFLVCFLVFCSYYAIPLLIIIVCYTKLAMHVTQSNRLVARSMSTGSASKSMKTKQRRVTKMVIVFTLSFAICWLPIHTLELMKCANSSILYTLIESYPKTLYTIRALAHALAYFNSCLNPYLYAILNRNFCYNLINICPWSFVFFKRAKMIKSNPPFGATSLIADETRFPAQSHGPDDDEDDDDEAKQAHIDVRCRIELTGS